jgi:hypothetical protein
MTMTKTSKALVFNFISKAAILWQPTIGMTRSTGPKVDALALDALHRLEV